MKWLLLLGDEGFHIVPGRARREYVLEHVECCKVCGRLLDLADAGSDAATIDEDLGVPEATLGTCTEDRVLPLDASLLDLVDLVLFLLECVHERHWLVGLGQVGKLGVLQNVLVVDRCILFGEEGLNLQLRVFLRQFFLSPDSATRHRYDLIECQSVERRLQIISGAVCTVLILLVILIILYAHHVVEARALGSWLRFSGHVSLLHHLTILINKGISF